MDSYICPLCASTQTQLYHCEQRPKMAPRDYHRCQNCQLVFVPAAFHLDPEAEKAVYDKHENDPTDLRYRRFLNKLCEPVLAKLTPGAQGLDFGSGPGPTLALMFEEAGYSCTNYDLYYCNRPEVLQRSYDFICSTEVFEHLSEPEKITRQLLSILKPGGWLALMTKRQTTDDAFPNWHYTLDRTHITFFADDSFRWLAKQHQLKLEFHGPDVVLLQKL